MKSFLIICLALSFSLSSCSTEDDEMEVLNGFYVESSPVEGRIKLEFSRGNMVTIIKEGGTRDKFQYEIRNNTLVLIPVWDTSTSTEHDLEIINSNRIQIGNMLPRFPEMPDTPVVFVKM